MAEAAINEIALRRVQATHNLINKGKGEAEAQLETEGRKVAYFVDQLKNPAEVELFRLIYQNNFYLIGVIRSEKERKRNLRDEGIDKANIKRIKPTIGHLPIERVSP